MPGDGGESTTEHTSTVTTTTTTNIRDIGLTGSQAVDLAAVLESGSISRAQINSDLVQGILQGAGSAWQQLMGGAGQIVETARQAGVGIVEAQTAALPALVEAEAGESGLVKAMPFVALAVVGAIIAVKKG